MKKQFFRFVLPSMIAFTFSGVFAIVDGFFIGRNIGDVGLAAINIAYPLTALLQAIGTGIGMGGAIGISISLGEGKKENVKKYLNNTILLIFAACIALTAILLLTAKPLLIMFGAEGEILRLSESYIRIIAIGAVFQIAGTGLVPIVRNLGGVLTAMLSMLAGFAANILLDYLFVSVYQYGMWGAALATILGQAVTLFPSLLFLVLKKNFSDGFFRKLSLEAMKKIIVVGLSPFGLTLSPNIVLMLMNKYAMIYGGESAVAGFAVISYVVVIVQMLQQGVGDGSQPLISRYYGEGKEKKAKEVRKLAYGFAAFVSVCNMAGLYALRNVIPPFFGASEEVAQIVSKTLPVFTGGFLFMGFLRITTSYFYASKKNKYAYMLIYGEPLLLWMTLAFIFPPIFQTEGVWISVPAVQCCLAVFGLYLNRKNNAEGKKAAINTGTDFQQIPR